MNTIISGYEIHSRNKETKNIYSKKKNNPCGNNISFKGIPQAAAKGVKTLTEDEYNRLIKTFDKYYGDIGKKVGDKLITLTSETVSNTGNQEIGKLGQAGNKLLQKSSRFSIKEGAFSIKDKTVLRSLGENIIFPFITLPLNGINWIADKARAIPSLKSGAEKLYRSPVLRVPRKLNELDWKTDSLKGILEKTEEVTKKFTKEEDIRENLYKVSNKFFNKYTGNFNTAYERPLNRIVTGLIPVAFLANDAYNLSVLCGDKKKDSQKEARERTNQEISRVFTTAFIQLLTFGAFTKQVNTIPWFAPVASAVTVLFSEVTSRKRNGKPIFFLSSAKAKEFNKNKSENENKDTNKTSPFSFIKKRTAKTENQAAGNKPDKFNRITVSPAQNTPNVFTSFKASAQDTDLAANQKNIKEGNDTPEKKEKKALINLKTFTNGVIILTAAGFALSFLKNSSYTKDGAFMKEIKKIGDFFKNKVYKPLAFKDFEISEKQFNSVMGSLEDAGCKEIADGHRFIKNMYGKTENGIIKMYKASLSSDEIPNITNKIIETVKKKAGKSLTEEESQVIKKSIETAINLSPADIAESKFENVAKQAQNILENHKINLTQEQSESFLNSITETIKANVPEKPIQVETKLRPFVDIVTQPFKFIFTAARLPFKIISLLIRMMVSPIEKKAAEAELGKVTLSKAEKAVHKAVTEVLGEKSNGGGEKISPVIFVNAIEKLQKKTEPCRKAKETLERLERQGASPEQIKKAQEAVESQKTKLSKYVYNAVEKSFNGVTVSNNKNTDLAMQSKIFSSAVTSAFLVADNYNMVMLKSDGENKEEAKEKANERIIQRVCALFYQTLFINWFNSTFKATYNSSLAGMTAVAIPNTLTTEIVTRKSIGMPIGRKTLDELNEIDEKNENRTGFAGKYFEFMRLLTGKKPLKDRLPQDKQQDSDKRNSSGVLNSTKTNLLEIFSEKSS